MSRAYDNAADARFQQGGRRNLIINGAMQVAQRGDQTGLSSTAYGPDRFRLAGSRSEATWDFDQSTDAPDGFSSSLKVTIDTPETTLSASDQMNLQQRLEGFDVQHLKKGTTDAVSVTLSFWVKSSLTTTWTVELYDTSNTRMISKTFSTNAANTWEFKSFTFAGDNSGSIPNDNTEGLRVRWWLDGGSNFTSGSINASWADYVQANLVEQATGFMTTDAATFQITGVQLEVGSVATPFENLSYGEQLSLCQRYYYNHTPKGLDGSTKSVVMNAAAYQTSSVFGVLHFPVPMRTSPTLDFDNTVDNLYRIFHNGTNTNCRASEFAIQRSEVNSIALAAQGLSGFTVGHAAWIETNAASGNVGMCCFDAEL